MAYDERLLERVRQILSEREDIVEKRMVGGRSFMVDGQLCCGVTDHQAIQQDVAEHPREAAGIGSERVAEQRHEGRSDVDWTIVYAPRLTDEPRSGGYRNVEGTLTGVGTISRADLADALLSTLSDATSVRQSRVVTSRLPEVSSSPETLSTARSRAT